MVKDSRFWTSYRQLKIVKSFLNNQRWIIVSLFFDRIRRRAVRTDSSIFIGATLENQLPQPIQKEEEEVNERRSNHSDEHWQSDGWACVLAEVKDVINDVVVVDSPVDGGEDDVSTCIDLYNPEVENAMRGAGKKNVNDDVDPVESVSRKINVADASSCKKYRISVKNKLMSQEIWLVVNECSSYVSHLHTKYPSTVW